MNSKIQNTLMNLKMYFELHNFLITQFRNKKYTSDSTV